MTFINTLSRKKLSMISGLLVGLSYPPGFGIIALFSLVPLMRVWLTSSPRSSLKYSFLSSIVCSMISLYWIGLNSGASIVPVIMSLVAAILYLSIFWITEDTYSAIVLLSLTLSPNIMPLDELTIPPS